MNAFSRLLSGSLTLRERISWVALFVLCFISVEVAMKLYAAPAVLSPVSGIVLAGLVVLGTEFWSAAYLGILFAYILNASPWSTIAILPAAYALQALAGTFILAKLGFDKTISRFRDMLSLIIVALATSVVVPTLGMAGRSFEHYFFGAPWPLLTWGSWWTGNILSILLIAPLMISWLARAAYKPARREILEILAVFAALIGINFLLFFTTIGQIDNISLVYFLLVPLMWLSLRIGTRSTTLGMFITGVIALASEFAGVNAPSLERLGLRVFQMEVLVIILSLIFFILMAVEEERKTALSGLRLHILQLEDAVGMRDNFISVASHELRTPVTALKIYSQVMRKELEQKGENSLARQISKMDSQLNKLISLVEDLLNVSRSRMGRLEFYKEEFDLWQLVIDTVEDIQSGSEKHAIRIEGGLNHTMWGDKDRIAQVIINLLNNAIKYSPQASEVKVILQDEGDRAKVTIRDFGIGIGPEHHEKIFDLFYRVSDSDSGDNTFPGFGIGLHISHEIIKRHEGEIYVESAKGHGSEFIFTLPYRRFAQAAEA